jgi:hypothetical protein
MGANDGLLFGDTWSCGLRMASLKEEGGARAMRWSVAWGRSNDDFSSVWWREEQSGSEGAEKSEEEAKESFILTKPCRKGIRPTAHRTWVVRCMRGDTVTGAAGN